MESLMLTNSHNDIRWNKRIALWSIPSQQQYNKLSDLCRANRILMEVNQWFSPDKYAKRRENGFCRLMTYECNRVVMTGLTYSPPYNRIQRPYQPGNEKEWLREESHRLLCWYMLFDMFDLDGFVEASPMSSLPALCWNFCVVANIHFPDKTRRDNQKVSFIHHPTSLLFEKPTRAPPTTG